MAMANAETQFPNLGTPDRWWKLAIFRCPAWFKILEDVNLRMTVSDFDCEGSWQLFCTR